ncbi:MAG: hypothetical protein K0Q90_2848 [Paenibacillaceae bacterium]|jgi:MYXO-CTERM domain-containing protein|nr:hypothetical protein [Paenibacillaceae bacterium]
MKKAAAFAAALTLSAVIAAPVFAEDSSMYGTGNYSPTPTTTPGTGMLNLGATETPHSSPFHTYSGTTGVNNYGTNGTNDMTRSSGTGGIYGSATDGTYTGNETGIDGKHHGYNAGTGTYHSKTYNALADTTKNTNWGWLGLVGLLGLAGLRGRSRDDDRGSYSK